MPYTAGFASARCLTKLHQPQDVDVVSEPSQNRLFPSLADLPRRRVPTFDIRNISLIFLGTRHCVTCWPPGPLRPGSLSRSPSITYTYRVVSPFSSDSFDFVYLIQG